MSRVLNGILDRIWTISRPKLPRLFYANGGIGDELLLTAIAHRARELNAPLPILTNLPELWRGNPDPATLQTNVDRWHYAKQRAWISTEIIHLPYRNGTLRHIADQMADHLDLSLPADWRPRLILHKPQKKNPKLVVLQNSCRGARYASDTKEWAIDRWLDLVQRIAPDFALVQLGTIMDPLLPGARDLRGQTTIIQAAELIAGAALFVGLESGLMHVAAAVETPAVIIYGGRSRPVETGYPFNTNLTRSPECAGCGLNTGCPHDLICLDIPVDEVEQTVRDRMNSQSS